MNEEAVERVLDDLRNSLTDGSGECWPDLVESCMTEAWDALLKLGPKCTC